MKLFKIIDPKTGKDVTRDYEALQQIALTEEWAKDLLYWDIIGWLIDDYGDPYLLDDTGTCVFRIPYVEKDGMMVPRFKVEWQKSE